MLTRHWTSLTRPLLLALVLMLPSAAGAVQLDIGNASGTVADTVTVAITTTDLTGLGVYAYELAVTWNSLYASAVDAPVAGTLTAPWGSVTANPQAGRIDVAAAGATALAGSGTLLNLRFVLGPNAGNVTLTFADFVFNEGTPADTLSNGLLSITALPTTNIYPDTGELVVGDSLQFGTSGSGTPPYTYSTSDAGVADFLGNDWLNALAPGAVTCTSTDFNGIMSTTTGLINVRALSLTAGTGAGNPGDTVLVAMTITDPSPYAITSAEFAVTYSGTYLTALGIEDAGTLA
ncbi:MAG: hypothetical protein OER90_12510, partial [Gemmatimonadota bacterium]|nr:hypothetical protein [Gemmatimonadota bacterium]